MKDVFRRYNCIVFGAKVGLFSIHSAIIYYCICLYFNCDAYSINNSTIAYIAASITIVAFLNAVSNWLRYKDISRLVSDLAKKEFPNCKSEFKNKVSRLFNLVKKSKYKDINLILRDIANYESRFYSGSSEKFMIYNIYLDMYRYKYSYLAIELAVMHYGLYLFNNEDAIGVFVVITSVGMMILNCIKINEEEIRRKFDRYLYTFDNMFINTLTEESRHD